MNTLFIGGSRHVSRLPADVKKRLDNVISSGHRVIVGDANGADKAVQKYFHDAAYDKVTVFCSGDRYRNNLGQWETHNVYPSKHLGGFHFYAAKDREMAQKADFGLMIWDGKSAGTVLNVLRLVRAGKIVVLFNVPDKRAINIKTMTHWEEFLSQCSPELRHDVRERATPEEWMPGQQSSFLKTPAEKPKPSAPTLADPVTAVEQADIAAPVSAASGSLEAKSSATVAEAALTDSETDQPVHAATTPESIDTPSGDLTALLNKALAESDPGAAVDVLGKLAKTHRMTQVAKDTGLARESLYRSLSTGGNPEFATVLKVLSSLGFRLTANPIVLGENRNEQRR
jgi:probable addiction module antidote protein